MNFRKLSPADVRDISVLILLGWLASVVVAAHHKFFFINPFVSNDWLRRFELLLFLLGWILLCVGPFVIAGVKLLLGDQAPKTLLAVFTLVVSIFYPLSVMLIQMTLWTQAKGLFRPYSFISNNKWFVVTDFLVPLGLLVISILGLNGGTTKTTEAPESVV